MQITVAVVNGSGGRAGVVAEILQSLFDQNKAPRTLEAFLEWLEVHKSDGLTNRHNIVLALLNDLHEAGQGARWTFCQTDRNGEATHSWLEWSTIAVDASLIEGSPVILVERRSVYRARVKKRGTCPALPLRLASLPAEQVMDT